MHSKMHKSVRMTLCVFRNGQRGRQRDRFTKDFVYLCILFSGGYLSGTERYMKWKFCNECMGNWKTVANFLCMEMLTTSERTVRAWKSRSKANDWNREEGKCTWNEKSKMCVYVEIYIIAIYMVYFPFASRLFTNIMHTHTREKKLKYKTKQNCEQNKPKHTCMYGY